MSTKRKPTLKKKPEMVWVVVVVESGVPITVEAYHDLKTAQKREIFFREEMNENDDAVDVFEVEIGTQTTV